MASDLSTPGGIDPLYKILEDVFRGSQFPPAPRNWTDNAWYGDVCETFQSAKACDSRREFQEICSHIQDELSPHYSKIVEDDAVEYPQFEAFALLPKLSEYLLGERACDSCNRLGVECMPRQAAANGKSKCHSCVQRKSSCSLDWIPKSVFNIQFAFRETDPAILEEAKASAVEQPVELSAAEKERAEAEETLKILERLICERKERLHQLMVALGELALTHTDSNLRAKA